MKMLDQPKFNRHKKLGTTGHNWTQKNIVWGTKKPRPKKDGIFCNVTLYHKSTTLLRIFVAQKRSKNEGYLFDERLNLLR